MFNRPKKFELHGGGHIANLIKQDRPTSGDLQNPFPLAGRAEKRTFDMGRNNSLSTDASFIAARLTGINGSETSRAVSI